MYISRWIFVGFLTSSGALSPLLLHIHLSPVFYVTRCLFSFFFHFFFLVWCVVCSLQLPAHTTLHIFNRVVAANLCMRRHKKVMDGFSKERSELKCIKFNAKKTGRIKRGKTIKWNSLVTVF